jgi:hypothetical protein
MIASTPHRVEQFVGGKKVLIAFGGSVLAATVVGAAAYFVFHAWLGNAWGTTVSQIVTVQVYLVLLITFCVQFRPVTEPPIALRPSGAQRAIASVGFGSQPSLASYCSTYASGRSLEAFFRLQSRLQPSQRMPNDFRDNRPGLVHCDSAWLFDSSDLRRGVLPRSFALMVAKALECTRRGFRNGSALRLDARIAGRGTLRVHLRGRRWVRSGTHRLNLQHNYYAFAE